jgi:hypothetical protein
MRKLVHCVAVTAACWALFLGLLGGVATVQTRFPDFMQTKHTRPVAGTQNADPSSIGQFVSKPLENVLADEAKRREIYVRAVSMRQHMERANARRSERRDKGLDLTVVDKQIEHIKKMHANRLDFTTRFYNITRQQLDEIIAEGDRKRWPTE